MEAVGAGHDGLHRDRRLLPIHPLPPPLPSHPLFLQVVIIENDNIGILDRID